MSDVSPKLGEFVAACKSVSRPTEADLQRVRAALQLRLGGVAMASQPAVTPHTARLLFGKASAIGLAGLVLLGSAWFFAADTHRTVSSESNAAPRAAATIKAAIVLAPSVAWPSPAPCTPLATGEAAAVPKPALESVDARPRPARDRLEEEIVLLSRAETALHSGNAALALTVLAEHERKFRRGQLVQERIAARIRALCALGRKVEADALLAQLSPKSPYGRQSPRACSSSLAP
jgi:hypothetical protein